MRSLAGDTTGRCDSGHTTLKKRIFEATPWNLRLRSETMRAPRRNKSRLSSCVNRVLLAACFFLLVFSLASCNSERTPVDPLPSWNDGTSKKAILDFVANTTTVGGTEFVPVENRIATFDNDGTLWVEQPIYTQFVFVLARLQMTVKSAHEIRCAVVGHIPERRQDRACSGVLKRPRQSYQSLAADFLAVRPFPFQ